MAAKRKKTPALRRYCVEAEMTVTVCTYVFARNEFQATERALAQYACEWELAGELDGDPNVTHVNELDTEEQG